MPDAQRNILVTSALPYANGPIHLGHLVEYIQTDIWARFQRLRGHRCIYVCADDAHGTPIMLRAEQDGVTPEELIHRIGVEHRADFDEFDISFDNFYTTHSEENRSFSNLIFARLVEQGHVVTRSIPRPYDPVKNMFLPDRYIRGTCPRCGAEDQYGDSCEVCGATYAPSELIDPVSVVSGVPPIERESEQYFVKLGDFEEPLRAWIRGEHRASQYAGVSNDALSPSVQPEIANKLDEWFDAGLQDWDISRNAPYFGFEIPNAPGKYFYVWLDAPIGYMASFKHLCARREDLDFDSYWGKSSHAELYHFIGKDIAYFHTLFWPAQLYGAGFRTPTAVFCHGFLTVNGQKMSKSRGTFVKARTYLEHLDPEYLRYYFACRLGNGIDDIDLNLDDFAQRVNADLVGKVVNIASRCAGFITKRFDGTLAALLSEPGLYNAFVEHGEAIAWHYESRAFAKAMREIMDLADLANKYIDEQKPWVLAKQAGSEAEVQGVCTMGLNLFRVLAIYLKPVLPAMARKVEELLDIDPLSWADLDQPVLGTQINAFRPLMVRVENQQVSAMIEAATQATGEPEKGDGSVAHEAALEPLAEEISYEDFVKVDMRVAQIKSAEAVDGADKLLRLVLDIGGETRNVLAGIKSAYSPEELTGRYTVVVANLTPKQMRFGVSQGMILAAGPGGEDIWLLNPDEGARVGMRVR